MSFRLIIACIGLLLPVLGKAQDSNVVIHDDAGAAQLIERHIFFNEEHGELPGYRIQIFAGTSLGAAKDAKANFLKQYDIHTEIVFEAPNYKVRVGNYTNRFDANGDLQLVKEQYTDALIVKDLITLSE